MGQEGWSWYPGPWWGRRMGSREQPHRDDISCSDVESSWVMEVPKILQSSDLQDS